MSAALQQPLLPTRMTRDEFLTWDAPGPGRWQLVDGNVVAMAPASDAHGMLCVAIATLLHNHLRSTSSNCRTIFAPGVVPRVAAGMNHRIPDVGVSCPDAGGPGLQPVLLIEVLSPGNEPQTRANVWAYTTIPSVQAVLLLRASRVEAELLRRGDDGEWPTRADIIGPDGTVVLASIGLSVPLAELYDGITLPG